MSGVAGLRGRPKSRPARSRALGLRPDELHRRRARGFIPGGHCSARFGTAPSSRGVGAFQRVQRQVVGVGEDEHFVASDASCLAGNTDKIVYLADHELAVVTPGSLRVLNRDSSRVAHNVEVLDHQAGDVDLGGFSHYMLKEIFEQPEAVRNTMRGRIGKEGLVTLDEVRFGPANLGLPDDRVASLSAAALGRLGLDGVGDLRPHDLGLPWRKRVAVASAIAMDTPVVVLDEPTGGQDAPGIAALGALIDDLAAAGVLVVVVTHELASIFTIGNNSVFLDTETRTMIAGGNPRQLLAETDIPAVRRFLTRGAEERT